MNPDSEIEQIEQQIQELKRTLAEARQRRAPEPVSDYTLLNQDGSPVRLSELFGDNDDLLVVHNMGRGCRYCTMWADGFESMRRHIERRASFVVVSPDPPAVQKEFAATRGWTFRMASGSESEFITDMGFANADRTDFDPGISGFHRNPDGTIIRTGRAEFGPGDDFCPPWPMFELLQGGAGNWAPV